MGSHGHGAFIGRGDILYSEGVCRWAWMGSCWTRAGVALCLSCILFSRLRSGVSEGEIR
jgi:hypothetical protein